MELDIGAARPIDGEKVYAVGEFLNSDPSYALLYDSSKLSPRTRYAKRNLKGQSAVSIVEMLGGSAMFGRLDAPDWGTCWIRRSMILDVVTMPPALARLGNPQWGAMVLMRFDPPLQSFAFVTPGTPFGFGFNGLTVERVKDALGV